MVTLVARMWRLRDAIESHRISKADAVKAFDRIIESMPEDLRTPAEDEWTVEDGGGKTAPGEGRNVLGKGYGRNLIALMERLEALNGSIYNREITSREAAIVVFDDIMQAVSTDMLPLLAHTADWCMWKISYMPKEGGDGTPAA